MKLNVSTKVEASANAACNFNDKTLMNILISFSQPLMISSDFMDKLRKLAQKVNYVPQLHQERGQSDDLLLK